MSTLFTGIHYYTGRYEKEGYEGCDVSLDISLNEYKLIWKKYKYNMKKGFKKGDYIFVYIDQDIKLHSYTGLNENTDVRKEYSWVQWQKVTDYTGMSSEEFFNREIPYIISDLVSYYGTENIFGSEI